MNPFSSASARAADLAIRLRAPSTSSTPRGSRSSGGEGCGGRRRPRVGLSLLAYGVRARTRAESTSFRAGFLARSRGGEKRGTWEGVRHEAQEKRPPADGGEPREGAVARVRSRRRRGSARPIGHDSAKSCGACAASCRLERLIGTAARNPDEKGADASNGTADIAGDAWCAPPVADDSGGTNFAAQERQRGPGCAPRSASPAEGRVAQHRAHRSGADAVMIADHRRSSEALRLTVNKRGRNTEARPRAVDDRELARQEVDRPASARSHAVALQHRGLGQAPSRRFCRSSPATCAAGEGDRASLGTSGASGARDGDDLRRKHPTPRRPRRRTLDGRKPNRSREPR